MNYWLRLYTGILDDPKVQRLTPEHFKGWVNLLCLAKERDGLLPGIEDIAFRLRIEDAQAEELIETLKARGLLDEAEGNLMPHNWAGRQYETEETATQNGALGNHKRWHIGRGIVADDCPYCRGDIAPESPPNRPRHRGESPPTSPGHRPDVTPNRPPNPEQSRAEADSETEAEPDSEQQQSRGRAEAILPAPPAAAAASSNKNHSSAFAFAEVEQFVTETKPHIRNPGGLATKLCRTGEEDAAIKLWKERKAMPKEENWPKWVFDPKEPGTVEEKKRFHRQLVEAQRRAEAEALAFNQQQATEGGKNADSGLPGRSETSRRRAGSEAGEPGEDLQARSQG